MPGSQKNLSRFGGARKMNGSEEPVGDEGVGKRLRSPGSTDLYRIGDCALILTVFSFFFASVLPETARSSRDMSLEQTADFLIRDGYAVLFGWVLQLRLFRNRDKTFVGGHRQLPGTPG